MSSHRRGPGTDARRASSVGRCADERACADPPRKARRRTSSAAIRLAALLTALTWLLVAAACTSSRRLQPTADARPTEDEQGHAVTDGRAVSPASDASTDVRRLDGPADAGIDAASNTALDAHTDAARDAALEALSDVSDAGSDSDAGLDGPADAAPDADPPRLQAPFTFRIHNAYAQPVYLGYSGLGGCDLAVQLAPVDTPDAWFLVEHGWSQWCDCRMCEMACDRNCQVGTCTGSLCDRSPTELASDAVHEHAWHGLIFSAMTEICPQALCAYGNPIEPGDYLVRLRLYENDGWDPLAPNPSSWVVAGEVTLAPEGGVVEVELGP